MNELSDWIWLAVAAVWIITRVLPRLFRARSRNAAPSIEQEPAAPQTGAEPEVLNGTPGPRPIEPR